MMFQIIFIAIVLVKNFTANQTTNLSSLFEGHVDISTIFQTIKWADQIKLPKFSWSQHVGIPDPKS